MATIIINAITHRAACLDGLGSADEAAYDRDCGRVFARMAELAKAEGFGFEVDQHGSGAASYRVVDANDRGDEEAAHEFAQRDGHGFWDLF